MRLGALVLASVTFVTMVAVQPVSAQPYRYGVLFEGAAVWVPRNDVRIPPDTGTEFSITDLIGNEASPATRVELTFDINDRHGFRLTYAPLQVNGSGVPATAIVFDDGSFEPGVPTDANYKFSSYRATYRYSFFRGDRWTWRVGATAFVRDARIRLEQPGVSAEYTDLGVVPLAHLDAEVRLSRQWRLVFDADGSAAPQGRAFDVSAKAVWSPTPRFDIGGGYRTIEGGADVDEVYNFAWLQFAVASVAIRF
jgi:hypothetical protein